jgi:hypothetical protein
MAKGGSVWTEINKIKVTIAGFVGALAIFVGNVGTICDFAGKHGVEICGSSDDDPFESLEAMSKYLER